MADHDGAGAVSIDDVVMPFAGNELQHEGVVARAAVQRVRVEAAIQRVVAGIAVQVVVTGDAEQRIVPLAAVDGIVAQSPARQGARRR